jgi:hypothetical protein
MLKTELGENTNFLLFLNQLIRLSKFFCGQNQNPLDPPGWCAQKEVGKDQNGGPVNVHKNRGSAGIVRKAPLVSVFDRG